MTPKPALAMALKYLRMFWKSLFVVIYPLVLLPVFLCYDTKAYRCMYIVLLMAGKKFTFLKIIYNISYLNFKGINVLVSHILLCLFQVLSFLNN